jgi:hypothetical protein
MKMMSDYSVLMCTLLIFMMLYIVGAAWINPEYTSKEPVLEMKQKRFSVDFSSVEDTTLMEYSLEYKFLIDCQNPDYVDQSWMTPPNAVYPTGSNQQYNTVVEQRTLPCHEVISPEYINEWITYNSKSNSQKFDKRSGTVKMVPVSGILESGEMRCCAEGNTCSGCFTVTPGSCSFVIVHPIGNILLRKGRCHSLCSQVNCRLTCPHGTVTDCNFNVSFLPFFIHPHLISVLDMCETNSTPQIMHY